MARFGRVPGLLDEASQPLYDTLLIAAGTLVYRFFTVPIGAAKSRLFTNMQLAGQLPAPQSFVVHAMRIILKEATSAIADDILNNTHCVFKVGEKEQIVLPTMLFSAGAGMWNNITTDRGQNGVPDARSLMVLPKPVVIGVNQAFFVDLIYDATPATDKDNFYVLCVLDGYQTRGVQ